MNVGVSFNDDLSLSGWLFRRCLHYDMVYYQLNPRLNACVEDCLEMPLYEFECKSCQTVVEVLVRSEPEKSDCPSCGGSKLERLLSVPASPAVRGKSLPTASEGCGAPRCCGGGCD